jgi:hypothetical protein
MKLGPGEGVARPRQAQLTLGRAVGVVEDRSRDPARGNGAQVGDRVRATQPSLDGIERNPLGPQ